jgi:hypothetical protein
VLFLAAAMAPAQAACAGNPLIKTAFGPIPQASFIWSQGQWASAPSYLTSYAPFKYAVPPYPAPPRPLSANTEATFWALGTGNPAVGPGDDAGGYTHSGLPDFVYPAGGTSWLYLNYSYAGSGYYYYFAGEIFTGWGASAAIDGCVQNNAPGTCTCLLITDHDPTDSYFAILSDNADINTWNTELSQPGSDGAGNFGEIILRPVPDPSILNTVRRTPSLDLDITVSVANPTSAIYGGRDGAGCACGPIGYKVLENIVLRGSPPPTNRDIVTGGWVESTLGGASTGTAQPANGTPMGTSVLVESICGSTDHDVYIATQLIFDSGFTTPVVSGNGTRIECGPNIAEPVKPRFRPGDVRPPARQPRRSR